MTAAPAREPDWRQAACEGYDRDLFFDDQHTLAALAICEPCPIRRPCLEWALSRGEAFGVWGGATAEQRRRMLLRPACSHCHTGLRVARGLCRDCYNYQDRHGTLPGPAVLDRWLGRKV